MRVCVAISKALWIGLPVIFALIFFLGSHLSPAYPEESPSNRPYFPRSSLTLILANGLKIPLEVEIATTPEQESYGLMFRKSIPAGTGMIFIANPDRIATFWMKNTLVALDMLFVRADGTIAKIVSNARPLDLSPISSGEPVRGIIEIGGGEALRQGLAVGDKVAFPGFGN